MVAGKVVAVRARKIVWRVMELFLAMNREEKQNICRSFEEFKSFIEQFNYGVLKEESYEEEYRQTDTSALLNLSIKKIEKQPECSLK